MSDPPQVSFGDRVRVRSDFVTNKLGLAESTGQVYGETTPSVTGIEVIGENSEDRAINVFLDGRQEAYWFAPQLLEFIDHGPGTKISIDGVDKKWIRTATGEWAESKTQDRPWWKFRTSTRGGK